MKVKLLSITFFILFLFSFIQPASATPITWKIEGHVIVVDDPLTNNFSVGDTMTAFFSFETETPDVEPWVSYRGKYENAASVVATIGNYTASADQIYMTVLNDYPNSGSDVLVVSSIDESNVIGADVGSYHFTGFNMSLKDNDGIMFSSIDLPETPPLPSLFDSELLHLLFGAPYAPNITIGAAVSVNDLSFSVVPPEPVPEPSTILLLSCGLLGLAWYARKRKKA